MEQKKSRKKQLIITLCVIAVLMIACISFLNARYIRKSDVENKFSPAVSVKPEVKETFAPNTDKSLEVKADDTVYVKKDVKFNVGNTDYPVYVRASIVINWKDNQGFVFYDKPKEATVIEGPGAVIDGDYVLDLNLSDDGWVKGSDGYYYFKKPVASGGDTDVLINKCWPTSADTGEKALDVEIIVQTVQAVGATDSDEEVPAYNDAWGNAWNS